MDKLKGKVVVSFEDSDWFKDSYCLVFDDGSRLHFSANYQLIESTLNSDVIPIGANTLGEGSV